MRTDRLFKNLIFILTIAMCVACAQPADTETLTIRANGAEHKFNIEFADDDEERRVGLMYRTELAEDAGMLFDFEEPQPISMWMKNTLIPLDMAFIDTEGKITRIAANTTPRSLASVRSGSAVIAVFEVNGGTFERLGIQVGATVAHPMFQTK